MAYTISDRYAGKRKIRTTNGKGELIDLIAKQDYEIDIAETKKRDAYKRKVRKATQEDLEEIYNRGKQKVVVKDGEAVPGRTGASKEITSTSSNKGNTTSTKTADK